MSKLEELVISSEVEAPTDLTQDELLTLITDLESEKISLLGEGECFVRKTEEGFVESVKVNIPLFESKKEIYSLGKKWCISADGYDKLNQGAGLSVGNPDTINIDGRECGNPHIELDKNSVVKSVTVRRIIVGPSPIGNMVAIERILRLDLMMYFIEDLQAKIKRRASAGGYGTMDSVPRNIEEGHNVAHFNVGPVVLWVDVEHPDIVETFSNHIKRCKYSDRIAIRICERNALASHPAIARRNVEPVAGVAWVPVFGGRLITDKKRITELIKASSSGKTDELEGMEVEVVKAEGIEDATTEDVLKVEEGVSDEFSPSDETEEKSESKEPVEKTAAWKAAHEQILGFSAMDPESYYKIVEKAGIRSFDTMTTEELNAFKKVLESS